MIGFGRAPCDEGVIRAAPKTPGCAEADKPWVLAATILGSSMAFIDGSMLRMKGPVSRIDYGASFEQPERLKAVQHMSTHGLLVRSQRKKRGHSGKAFGLDANVVVEQHDMARLAIVEGRQQAAGELTGAAQIGLLDDAQFAFEPARDARHALTV